MALFTFIQDNSVINLTKLKAYLRIDHEAYDVSLKLILAAVKSEADAYCQNNFTEEEIVPAAVELWILKTCSYHYELPNSMQTHRELEELGADSWKFDYDTYFHGLKPFRREVGFA